MNYRHAYHAGNFADVVKHIVLTRLVTYLQRKDKAFRIFDTHAGIGTYDLTSEQAQKTGEWKEGVKRVREAREMPAQVREIIVPWLAAVETEPEGFYPGSPQIVRHLMRKQDRLTLYELHEEDFAALSQRFKGDYQTRVLNLDGWLAAGAHLPPKEGRGMVLVDPPFEVGNDFDQMIDTLQKARKRFAGGTVALWYPVKRREHTDEWLGTLRALEFPDLLNIELYIREPRKPGMLNGCGMVIANPPYTLKAEMNALLPWLAKILAQDKGAGFRIQDLSKR
ncbi:23S rRNA (adenine(2030)-N(6))-methyltransferase RlmJ [Pseudahrensia aquimaris]|uniref:Ribosomal RNA large subunit methyltransferase J n=1 Tax=Pseudahrensia aquimaris TaxID=744461 RepID=A0ABW3FFV1_9HYPH